MKKELQILKEALAAEVVTEAKKNYSNEPNYKAVTPRRVSRMRLGNQANDFDSPSMPQAPRTNV